jgi:hypothetical protein
MEMLFLGVLIGATLMYLAFKFSDNFYYKRRVAVKRFRLDLLDKMKEAHDYNNDLLRVFIYDTKKFESLVIEVSERDKKSWDTFDSVSYDDLLKLPANSLSSAYTKEQMEDMLWRLPTAVILKPQTKEVIH